MICERCGQYFERRGAETVCSFTCYKKRKEGIKPDFVQVEREDLEELVGIFMRVSDWGNPDFKFDKLNGFIEKYLKKGQ